MEYLYLVLYHRLRFRILLIVSLVSQKFPSFLVVRKGMFAKEAFRSPFIYWPHTLYAIFRVDSFQNLLFHWGAVKLYINKARLSELPQGSRFWAVKWEIDFKPSIQGKRNNMMVWETGSPFWSVMLSRSRVLIASCIGKETVCSKLFACAKSKKVRCIRTSVIRFNDRMRKSMSGWSLQQWEDLEPKGQRTTWWCLRGF